MHVCLFNQDGTISLNGQHLNSVDWDIYLGSNISSAENDANICITKALTAIDNMEIWFKTGILPNWGRVITIVMLHYLPSTTDEESAMAKRVGTEERERERERERAKGNCAIGTPWRWPGDL